MRFISFAYTTPALLCGRKSVTRRAWKDNHAKCFKAGQIVSAFDKDPRGGGVKVAEIILTADPQKEALASMPDSDYEKEGFDFLSRNLVPRGKRALFTKERFNMWRDSGETFWVVRFKLNIDYLLENDLLERFDGKPNYMHHPNCPNFCNYACNHFGFDIAEFLATECDEKVSGR